MTGVEVVQEIVNILISGLMSLGTGIGQGISNFATALAFTGTGESQTFSVYFILLCVFAAIAMATGLTRLVFGWLSSLGGRN